MPGDVRAKNQMFALDSLIVVALISSMGALLVALVTSVIGGLYARKTKAERTAAEAQKNANGMELAHRVLTTTIEWDDKEIAELRAEVRDLKVENRRLERELSKQGRSHD